MKQLLNLALVSRIMEIEEDRFSFLTYGLYRGWGCGVSPLAALHLPKNFFQEVLCKACEAVPGHYLGARSLNMQAEPF